MHVVGKDKTRHLCHQFLQCHQFGIDVGNSSEEQLAGLPYTTHMGLKVEQPDSTEKVTVQVDARHETFLYHRNNGKLALN